MKLIFIGLLSIVSIVGLAQQQVEISDPNAKSRILNGSFSAITVSDGIVLYLSAGDQESIAVSFSDAKYEERFKTEVENGVLKIYFDNNGFNWNTNVKRKLTAYVSYKELKKLYASGGADVIVPVPVKVDNLEMKFTSGTQFTGKITANELEVIQNSGSQIDMSGSALKINIEASSGALFKGYDLAVDYCTAKATSGGAIRISIKKELDAKANSGGAIRYIGEAIIKEVDVHSGGIVKRS